MRILLVEDDPLVSDAIVRGLATAGYVVDAVTDAESVQGRLDTAHYDLAIVDLGLPGEDGFSLVRRLRRDGSPLPLLIVTARDGLDDRVNALDLGADDYLVKPFALPELAARCRALIRRATAAAANEMVVGQLRIDLAGRRAIDNNGRVLELTRREWSILECLAHHSGRVVSKERLIQAIVSWDEEISGNAIEVHVSRLRAKLGEAATVRGIRGLGYRLDDA
ncbi:response regulator [Dyella mobilis]|uniref:Response regulator n=1 Tax=Dyella mobilis TaxID=1849582 RepID=A0ABS2KBI4_9GAMM|nr:response regulator [Dyella mobilis]MBM7128542.1 response regulator [Dyella mobilis]GLQ99555.1 DNA-binding response regulator [Dyella mobilis]